MKTIVSIGLMVVGFVMIGLGGAMVASSENQKYCEEFHLKAIAILENAEKVKGTPREQELMDEAQSESDMAEQMCSYAAQTRQNAMLVAGGGWRRVAVGVRLRNVQAKVRRTGAAGGLKRRLFSREMPVA